MGGRCRSAGGVAGVCDRATCRIGRGDLPEGAEVLREPGAPPCTGRDVLERQHPFQTFLWSDYECDPQTQYQFDLFALYGTPAALERRYHCSITISTEAEDDGRHGIWFNRGAVASHALSAQFQNRQVTDALANKVDAQGFISDAEAKWLSRGLASLAMMTIPFNVAPEILAGLQKKRDSMRLVILENPPKKDVLAAQKANQGKLLFSNGALAGKQFIRNPRGGAKVIPIPQTKVDQWFIDEELARPLNGGHVYFMHAKTLLIDPLSSDPLVCSGSANFSKNSLTANDENMLLIRGETRVAEIYMTEFDRIFRHFYARDALNRIAESGGKDNPLPLDETGQWVVNYFKGYKNNRQQLFFPGSAAAAPAWAVTAAKDPDEFKNEQALAQQNRRKKSGSATGAKKKSAAKAKGKTAKKKTPKKKGATKKKPAKKK